MELGGPGSTLTANSYRHLPSVADCPEAVLHGDSGTSPSPQTKENQIIRINFATLQHSESKPYVDMHLSHYHTIPYKPNPKQWLPIANAEIALRSERSMRPSPSPDGCVESETRSSFLMVSLRVRLRSLPGVACAPRCHGADSAATSAANMEL